MKALRSFVASALVWPLATLVLPPGPAAQAAALARMEHVKRAPARVGIAVDTSGLEDAEAGPVARQIEQRAQAIWLKAEVLPAQSDRDPVVQVVVVRPEGENDSYEITVQVLAGRDGDRVGAPDRVRCELCTEGEMLEKVAEMIGPMLSRAVAAQPGDEAAAPPEPKTEEGPPAAAEPGTAEPDIATARPAIGDEGPKPPGRAPLGPAGKAGIGVLAVGVASLATGAGLAAAGDRVRKGSGGSDRVSLRPPGYALLGVGGALLVTGVVLVLVDRRRAAPDRRRVRAAPGLLPAGGGLVLHGRF